jgi:two-component system, NtrC family, response regulator AtoC
MRGETILIVDDEKLIRWSLRHELVQAGFTVFEADTVAAAIQLLTEHEPDLMILDQMLPDGTGIDLLRKIQETGVVVPVIMLTAVDRSDTAVQAMKLGAFDYVTKPVNNEELRIVIEKALESTRLKRQVAHFLKAQEKQSGFCGMIGFSEPMLRVFATIPKIAQSSRTTVLITGESGTGKELAAHAIHTLSDRSEFPLMMVNFSALSESLIESELFGHEKGAFTDARTQKKGLFELSDKGSIFLDEIGDTSLKTQVKLLRVLEQKTFQRVGGTADITVDVRIIAATNQSLENLISAERFRSDLYYRLNVATIEMPPLRSRGEDVLRLAEYFLHEFNGKFHKQFKGFTPDAQSLFLEYSWPGNVRELRNVLERTILLSDEEFISAKQLSMLKPAKGAAQQGPAADAGADMLSLYDLEKRALEQALSKAGNNQSQAAKILKITRDTLRYRMKKYGLLDR